ncbi:MAG: DMT family transporter [Thalassovita sp.]|nr:DMT family transporter [Thalassovita sp.]
MKGALWMSGAIASFTSMAVAGRAVSFELDTFEIMMYRSIVGVAIVVVVASLAGTLSQIRPRNLGLHLVRNISHFAGQNLWFYAITVIPLAQVFALEFTAPLWAMLLAPLVLNERLTGTRVIAAIIGFAGILIVARPSPDSFEFGQLAAALAAIGFAGSAVFTRKLTRSETITCILFFLTLMQATFGLICAGFDGDIALPSMQTLPWLVLIAVAGLVAHFCLTTALSLAPAIIVMPIDFTRLPLIAIVGWFLYHESIDLFVVGGAALIFGANYFNIWTETRKRA